MSEFVTDPPDGDAAFDAYALAYFAHLALVDQHPCVQAAAADCHEGLDGSPPHDHIGISPARFSRAYDYRVAVWRSNLAGRAELARRWPILPIPVLTRTSGED